MPRPDPLAWPGSRTLRLTVLALLILLVSIHMGASLPPAFSASVCREIVVGIANCEVPLPTILLGLPSAILVLFGAGALFAVFPTLIQARERVPPQIDVLPERFTDWVSEEIARAGLQDRVAIDWVLADPRARARVYGLPRRYHLLLCGGMLGLFLKDPGRARAVVRHELAHIRHGDVEIVFAALSLWYSFLVLVLGPALLATILGLSHPLARLELAVYGPTVLLLLALRNLTLQDVEFRADLSAGALIEAGDARDRRFRIDWLDVHPSRRARSLVLERPLDYLRVRSIDWIASSAVGGLAVSLWEVLPAPRTDEAQPAPRADILAGIEVDVTDVDVGSPTWMLPRIILGAAAMMPMAELISRAVTHRTLTGVCVRWPLSLAGWCLLGVLVSYATNFGLALFQMSGAPPSQFASTAAAWRLPLVGLGGFVLAAFLTLWVWLRITIPVVEASSTGLLSRAMDARIALLASFTAALVLAPAWTVIATGVRVAPMVAVLPRGPLGDFSADQVATFPTVLAFAFLIQPGTLVALFAASAMVGAGCLSAALASKYSANRLLPLGQMVELPDPRRSLRGVWHALAIFGAGMAIWFVLGYDQGPSLEELAGTSEAVSDDFGAYFGILAIVAILRAGAGRERWRWLTVLATTLLIGLVAAFGVLLSTQDPNGSDLAPELALRAGFGIAFAGLLIASPFVLVMALFLPPDRKSINVLGSD